MGLPSPAQKARGGHSRSDTNCLKGEVAHSTPRSVRFVARTSQMTNAICHYPQPPSLREFPLAN